MSLHFFGYNERHHGLLYILYGMSSRCDSHKNDTFSNIVEELLRHYHSVSNKPGKSSKQFAKLWPQVIEFHRQFRVTWPHMWTDAYCATLSMSPLHEDAQQHYAKLAHMFSPSPSKQVGLA